MLIRKRIGGWVMLCLQTDWQRITAVLASGSNVQTLHTRVWGLGFRDLITHAGHPVSSQLHAQ